MVDVNKFLKHFGFIEDTYYKVVDGVVYRNVKAGLIKVDKPFHRPVRNAGGVKIYAEKFEAVDPYTAYFVIADGKVYRVESTMSMLTDMVATLKGERAL